MHIRFSTCIGLPVVEEGSEHFLGMVSGILINPDSGKVEGFFVRVSHFFQSEDLFCSALDVLRWGARVHVSDAEVIAPAGDRVRLQPLLSDRRTILGQRIVTESGKRLGICKDVQFDTERMRLEWLFPRRFFRWGLALPVSEIVEVTQDAIIVRDPPSAVKETVVETKREIELPELPEATIPRPG